MTASVPVTVTVSVTVPVTAVTVPVTAVTGNNMVKYYVPVTRYV